MDHFAGLDVSIKETSICIVDDAGKIVREVKGGERTWKRCWRHPRQSVSGFTSHLPWLWADASDLNTIDLAGVPPGQHKVLIELVNANHQVFPACATCSQTVTFTVPETKSRPH